MFKVGQKVVSIMNDVNDYGDSITKGEIYTINVYRFYNEINNYGVELKEKCDAVWLPDDFRPIDETFAESVIENIKYQIKEDELVIK